MYIYMYIYTYICIYMYIYFLAKTAHKFFFVSDKLKNPSFSDVQDKSNFQKFSTKFLILFEDILNYLNINFHEKKTLK